MAMLQLLIIRNYSRRISCVYIVYLLDIFDSWPEPIQPDPRMHPTHVQLWLQIKQEYRHCDKKLARNRAFPRRGVCFYFASHHRCRQPTATVASCW